MVASQGQVTGRPRSFDTVQVLDTALELFWLQGYRETSTRDLEAHLGISQSSLYNAFGSKQQLLDSALERYERRISDELLLPLEQASDGIGAIDRFFAGLGTWISTEGRRGCMILNLMAETADSDDHVASRTRSYRRRLRAAFRSALERERAANPGTIDDEVQVLVTAVLGINIAARGGAKPTELRRSINALRRLVRGWKQSA
jgi:TetR/AcrR family transcriptional repressor of nem operon